MTSLQKKAIVLLSGGLDSITVLAHAKKQGFKCYALSFDYGQRHNAELIAAAQIAKDYQVEDHKIIKLGLSSIGGSALTDDHIAVPKTPQEGIPVTYVPARNTYFFVLCLRLGGGFKAKRYIYRG
jgi:Predicted PP-loop superfamily ATPase